MTFDSSLLTYFMHAGLIVKAVMVLLIGASILSWAYIMQRGFYLKDVRRDSNQFENNFWSGKDLSTLYAEMNRRKGVSAGTESLFQAGYKEYLRLPKSNLTPELVVENVKRAMRVAQTQEQESLEKRLPALATIGSISPYVGLFGTVWGIMMSFRALAGAQQVTIAMVAPGIAEALIATAMGLFAAIPAVVAYNRYASEINRLLNRFDAFQDEFCNLLFRQVQTEQATGG